MTRQKSKIFIIVAAAVVTLALCLALAPTAETSAKYVLKDSHEVQINVTKTHEDPIVAINWILDSLDDPTSSIGIFFKKTPRDKATLDSTGFNYGIPISAEMVDVFGLDEVNFSFRIYHYKENVGNRVYWYYNVFFANTAISELESGAVVENVYCYLGKEQTLTLGTCAISKKNLEGKYHNVYNADTYTVTETLPVDGLNI